MSASSTPSPLAGPNSPNSVSATSALSSSEQLREALRQHIKQAARYIKVLDLVTYAFSWFGLTIFAWLALSLLEHWLTPLPGLARWGVWLLWIGLTSWFVVRKLIPLLLHRINPDYVALRIEQSEPALKSGLLSWLQLDAMPNNGVPRGIMAGLVRHAVRHMPIDDPSASIDTRGLIRLLGTVALLSVFLILYAMLSPKSPLVTGQRILMPWASISPPARVRLVSLNPGSCEITQGKPLTVDIELLGLRHNEPVVVRYSTTDGQLRDQRKELEAVNERYHYVGNVVTVDETTRHLKPGVQHELDYWIEAGDLVDGPYRVTLSRLPAVSLDTVTITHPAYTKIPPRTQTSGQFDALEGSTITVAATANQSLSRGRLEIDPELDANGELLTAAHLLDMQVDDRKLAGQWKVRLNSANENPTTTHYRIRGFNRRGDANQDPIDYTARVIADVAPEISIPGPDNRTLRMLPTGQVNIEVRANDPDFGLTSLKLKVTRLGMPFKKACCSKATVWLADR